MPRPWISDPFFISAMGRGDPLPDLSGFRRARHSGVSGLIVSAGPFSPPSACEEDRQLDRLLSGKSESGALEHEALFDYVDTVTAAMPFADQAGECRNQDRDEEATVEIFDPLLPFRRARTSRKIEPNLVVAAIG